MSALGRKVEVPPPADDRPEWVPHATLPYVLVNSRTGVWRTNMPAKEEPNPPRTWPEYGP